MRLKITEQHYRHLDSEYCGICTKCGYSQEGVEPDAEKYECEGCGTKTVFGAAQLLLLGKLIIVDSDEEDNVK